jgi:hypothetical protein
METYDAKKEKARKAKAKKAREDARLLELALKGMPSMQGTIDAALEDERLFEENRIQRLEDKVSLLKAPKTAKNVDPKTAKNVPPKTAKNVDPKTAKNVDPKTAKNVDPKTAKNVEPRTSKVGQVASSKAPIPRKKPTEKKPAPTPRKKPTEKKPAPTPRNRPTENTSGAKPKIKVTNVDHRKKGLVTETKNKKKGSSFFVRDFNYAGDEGNK